MVVVRQVPAELLPELADGLKLAAMDQIRLERVKERLDVGVLAGRPASGHALAHAAGGQALTKRRAEILAAAIAVKDHASSPNVCSVKNGVVSRRGCIR